MSPLALGMVRGVGLAAAVALLSCSPEDRDFEGSSGGCGQPEACFDGQDNDCDGNADCADTDCDAGAVCVANPTSFALGVLVDAAEPCPEGFTASETLIYRGLSDSGCEGCGCMADPTDCHADAWHYPTPAQCTNDINGQGGIYAGKIGFNCTADPINANDGSGFLEGVRVGPLEVTQSCLVNGAAQPAAPAWQQARKFCRVSSAGAGCAATEACVPRQDPAAQCAFVTGSSTCEGYERAQDDWYTGAEDGRTCSDCSCTATGGSCDGVVFSLGSDYVCTDSVPITPGTTWCGGSYAPPARLTGAPTQGTCTAEATATGPLTPTGQSTLCCLE